MNTAPIIVSPKANVHQKCNDRKREDKSNEPKTYIFNHAGWSGSIVHNSEHRGGRVDVSVLDGVDVSSLFDVRGSIDRNNPGMVDTQDLRQKKDNIHAGQGTVTTWRFRVVSGRPRACRNYLF